MYSVRRWMRAHAIELSLGLILLFGLVLRLYALSESGMWIDETISALVSERIVETGIPRFESGLLYTRALVFHYLSALTLFGGTLFGLDATLSVRIFSVLIGLATIVLVYRIGKTYSVASGLFAAALCAVLYFEVAFSRQVRFYQLFQLIFYLTIFLLYLLWERRDTRYAYAALIAWVVCINTQLEGLALAPLVLFVFYRTRQHTALYLALIPILYYGASAWTVIAPDPLLASSFLERYSRGFLYRLGGFLILSSIGIIYGLSTRPRLTLFLLIPSLLLGGGLLVLDLYGLRYAYVLVFMVVLFVGVLGGAIYRRSRLFGILFIGFVLIYPSNLVFEEGYFTVLIPDRIEYGGTSEPLVDYSGLNATTHARLLREPIIATWTPGVRWYFAQPAAALEYSLTGKRGETAVYAGVDQYTGAPLLTRNFPLNESFLYLEDLFGLTRLTPDARALVNTLKERCTVIDHARLLTVYQCRTET